MDAGYMLEIGQSVEPCVGISIDEEVQSDLTWSRINHWAFGSLCNLATWTLYFPSIWLDICPYGFRLFSYLLPESCASKGFHTLWYAKALFSIYTYWESLAKAQRRRGRRGKLPYFMQDALPPTNSYFRLPELKTQKFYYTNLGGISRKGSVFLILSWNN